MIREKQLNNVMKKEKLLKSKRTTTKLFPQILLIFFLIISTSCGKSSFNKKIFTEVVNKNDFVTTEIDNETMAISTHYQISLYKFKDEKTCEKEYKKVLKKYNDADVKEKDNYFYVKNENVYTIIYKVDNYYIESSAPSTYEKEIKKIIKEMNLEL